MTNTVLASEITEHYALYNGDCIEVMTMLPPDSVGLSLFSPPYLSLYVYSSSPRDMGNAATDSEFMEHFGYAIDGLMRITMPGRIVAVDCMNVPAMNVKDGYIGLKDFRGDLIRAFLERGFIFHSEHCIWKDPLIEATRTKALGLMHKQLCKDSAMCRSGIPQYLLAFRKPGENPVPIAHPAGLEWFAGEDEPTDGVIAHERWRRYASPVWMDIRPTRTLNYMAARSESDERHIAPMALDIIERAVRLWTNPADVVLTPFLGIGSEAYVALKLGRRAVGIELKESYFRAAVRNLEAAVAERGQATLFELEAAD